MENLATAAVLGVVEGLTEFLPVSSTGHLIILIDLLRFQGPPGRIFEIAIQLGAILAVCWVYRGRLLRIARGLPTDPSARHFAIIILIAFLPAAAIGAALHGFIKDTLFSPWVVATSLIAGGIAILAIERFVAAKDGRSQKANVDALGYAAALKIGLFQTLAMIPGVSRSGATVMGAMLVGVNRPTAAEFSFFLAIPTMLGATTFDLYKNRADLDGGGALLIGVGFVTAFLVALVVVRTLVTFISRHGFAPFGWYRILVGVAMFALLVVR